MKKALLLLSFFLLLSCASVNTLPGGERDISPPNLTNSSPDSAQVLFYSKIIKLHFDEYFTVQDLNKELIISPPFEKPITYKIKGKSLIIELPSYPLTETTYQLHFGSAIKDVNEGNVLNDLSLVFATGKTIDTGYISGNVISSHDLKPKTKCKVVLYNTYNDSNVFKNRPYYLTYTDSFGNFKFNHIAEGTFQINALSDHNFNNKLEFGEAVGFQTALVKSNSSNILLQTSNYKDNRKLLISNSLEVQRGVFEITFNRPLINDSITIHCNGLSTYINKQNHLPVKTDKDKTKATIYLSIKDSSEMMDSILFKIRVDTNTHLQTIKRKNTSFLLPQLLLQTSAIQNFQPILLLSNTPIIKTTSGSITLFNITDSLSTPILKCNINNLFEIEIEASMLEGKEYRMVLPSAATSFFNNHREQPDTFYFRTYKKTELGSTDLSIIIDTNLLKTGTPLRLEIYKKPELNQATPTIVSKIINKDTTLIFTNLNPGEYFAFAYFDNDGNGSWTDADYAEKRQSERKFIKPEPIIIRANWENKNIRFNIR